ncbi:MAG: hypothetical protein AB1589_05135 [Cyanobacteriota bacterium]
MCPPLFVVGAETDALQIVLKLASRNHARVKLYVSQESLLYDRQVIRHDA